MNMKKLGLSALVLFVAAAFALTLRSGSVQSAGTPELTTNAAYRDGLYVGRLAAEQGSEERIPAGRWAFAKDRAAFAAGYEQAYNQLIAERVSQGGQQ